MSPIAMLIAYIGIGVGVGALLERYAKPPTTDLPPVVAGLMWPATLLFAFLALVVRGLSALISFLARLIP